MLLFFCFIHPFFFDSSCFAFFQNHITHASFPPTPENPESREDPEDIPSASSPKNLEEHSLFDEDVVSSSTTQRNKEEMANLAEGAEARRTSEGAEDSRPPSRLPSPASGGNQGPVNSLGVPIIPS